MKNYLMFLILLMSLFISGCASQAQLSSIEADRLLKASGFSAEKSAGFVPIEPIIADSQIEMVKNGVIISTDIRLLSNKETLDFLADSWSKISVSKVNTDGSLTYLTASLTNEKGRYVAIMDYTKYFIEDMIDKGITIGRVRTGIGLRLLADINTKKSKIDLGGLLKIGLAASKNELSGSLEVRAIGVTSNDIDALLPGMLPAINESSIQTALEAMAAVKAKFREGDTVVSPRYIAIELYESTQNPNVKAPGL